MIADKLGIPWISSMPTPFIVESKTTTPTYMGGWYPREGLIYKIRDAVGRFVIRNFKRAVCFLARKELKPLGFKLYDKNGEEYIIIIKKEINELSFLEIDGLFLNDINKLKGNKNV